MLKNLAQTPQRYKSHDGYNTSKWRNKTTHVISNAKKKKNDFRSLLRGSFFIMVNNWSVY